MAIAPAALHYTLMQAAEALKSQRVEGLFDATPDRASRYRCEAAELTLDFSKHLLDDEAWQTLLELSDERALPTAFTSLTDGEMINTSEHRPALHTLLRGTARDRAQKQFAAATGERRRAARERRGGHAAHPKLV